MNMYDTASEQNKNRYQQYVLAIILYKALFTTLNQNYIQEYQYTQQRMALLRFYRLLHSGNEHSSKFRGVGGGDYSLICNRNKTTTFIIFTKI